MTLFAIAQPEIETLADVKVTNRQAGDILEFDGTNWVNTPNDLGTLTNFSFTNANGVNGVVTNPTTTPNLTISLSDITPSTVNALTLAAQGTGFTIAGGAASKTLTVSNNATVSGTNTGDITLSGQNYLTLSAQAITVNAVDLSSTNATGILAAGRFPALTGDITTTAGSLTTTLANSGVIAASYSVNSASLFTVDAKGRITSANNITISASPSGSAGGDLMGTYPNPTITSNAVTTTKIAANNVTYAKLQQASANSRLLGSSSTALDITEISLGSGLSISGTTISATGSGGTVTSIDIYGNDGIQSTGGPITSSGVITLSLGDIVPNSVEAIGPVIGSNLSGTNTGDQTITLTGDVTGSGTGSFAATIANNAVTDAKIRTSAACSVIGRSTNSIGNVADISAATNGNLLRRSANVLGFGTIDANDSNSINFAVTTLNIGSNSAKLVLSQTAVNNNINFYNNLNNTTSTASTVLVGTANYNTLSYSSGSTSSTAHGVDNSFSLVVNSGASVTDAIGVRSGGFAKSGAGTLTNSYSGYFVAPTGGATSNVALFATNLAIGTFTGTTPPSNGVIISGNLGIGTKTPQSKGHVAGTAASRSDYGIFTIDTGDATTGTGGSGFSFGYDSGTSTSWIYSRTNGVIGRNININETMSVAPAGNVGIGTTAGSGERLLVSLGASGDVVNLRSGNSSNYAALGIGRASTEARMAIAAASGQYAGNAAAGDCIIRSESNSLLLNSGSNDAAILIYSDNVAFFGGGSWGGGVRTIFIRSCSTVPTSNPTGGIIMYVDSGTLKCRGSSGTVTALAGP